jgi:hypothetical protein
MVGSIRVRLGKESAFVGLVEIAELPFEIGEVALCPIELAA